MLLPVRMKSYAILLLPLATAFVSVSIPTRSHSSSSLIKSSPFDEFLGNLFGDKNENENSNTNDDLDVSTFQQELAKRQDQQDDIADLDNLPISENDTTEFDGYAMRDAIYNKWGECFDVDFNRVDSYGFRSVYLNIMPFRLGGKRFRHETELDYLCHLQAVVEILQKYDQLDYVLAQLNETTKVPRAGTSPLIAVPLRLDLTEEQVNSILG